MKIAQIAPIWERVPPPKYGGTQRIVYNLTEGLVKAGHKVTLFATGDSQSSAKLVSVYPRALYRDKISWDNYFWPTLNAAQVFDHQNEFDIIHYHIDRRTEYIPAFPVARLLKTPIVFTIHFTILHSPEAAIRKKFLSYYKDLNFVSISNFQRKTLPAMNFIATVYNGIEVDKIKFHSRPSKDLVWLGRYSFTKGAREAIQIAKKMDRRLIMAGKLDKLVEGDFEYYKKYIQPEIDNKMIVNIGEIDARGRDKLFSQAEVLLNPLQWDEPFGLVPAEAMAAGIPVIAFRRGAMPEIIKDGQTGFLVDDINQAVAAIKEVDQIDRLVCREHVKNNFSLEKMVKSYEKVYQKILGDK